LVEKSAEIAYRLRMSLIKRFYTDRYLHIRTFGINLAVSAALCVTACKLHTPEFYHFHFAWWDLALIPLGLYIAGISAVFIHNATHNSFPSPLLNWLGGQLAGLHQLWGYMGWKLIHLIHHQYSDDNTLDTHPPRGLTFGQFVRTMFFYSSAKISERYREHWGMTLRTKVLHKTLLVIFLSMAVCNLLFWYLLLGPVGFLFFYVPSYVGNYLIFCDINYFCHPLNPETGKTDATNMDHTLYYKVGNALWFGIYYHGNHHRRPTLFNPKKMVIKTDVAKAA